MSARMLSIFVVFHTRSDRPWGPPSLLYNRPFPGVKRPECGVDHPPLSGADVEERVELYLYSTSGPSWPVPGWNLPLRLRKQKNTGSFTTLITEIYWSTRTRRRALFRLLISANVICMWSWKLCGITPALPVDAAQWDTDSAVEARHNRSQTTLLRSVTHWLYRRSWWPAFQCATRHSWTLARYFMWQNFPHGKFPSFKHILLSALWSSLYRMLCDFQICTSRYIYGWVFNRSDSSLI